MARTKKTKSNEEYTPNKEDKKKLLRIFHSMPRDVQHKDLLTTKRVIKKGNKKQLDEWKNNPKAYDIRGIDTQPEELLKRRLDYVTNYAGNPKIDIREHKGIEGEYEYYPGGGKSKKVPKQGIIRINNKGRSEKEVDILLSHELGHAFHRNVKGNLDEDYYNFKKMQPNPHNKKQLYNEILAIDNRIVPYNKKKDKDFTQYRNQDKELFANFFRGLLTNKNTIKKGKSFYNIFKMKIKIL
ncbi:hypothetical protein [Methanococcus voltae]|uniref:hypothetical protein n=1 Tax=Methanococcus voltae TaxID=2188 RepID=UPI001AE7D815|nr:hypothetical protein [Methanococcus voltae]MBP2173085.1 hypothetical protein [Methanococcus voltae]